MALNEGWVYIDYGGTPFQIKCKHWECDLTPMPDIEHIEGDVQIGWDLKKRKRILKIKGLYFLSDTDLETFISNIETLNYAGAYDIRIKNASATGSWAKLNGSDEELTMLCIGINGISKIARGEGQLHEIKLVVFEEAG